MNQSHLSTGAAAARLAVSPRTLRYYEECQLIHPQRSPGGQRRYTQHDLARLHLILTATRHGLSLEEIRHHLSHNNGNSLRRWLCKQASHTLQLLEQAPSL